MDGFPKCLFLTKTMKMNIFTYGFCIYMNNTDWTNRNLILTIQFRCGKEMQLPIEKGYIRRQHYVFFVFIDKPSNKGQSSIAGQS
jgi:hypothetical protein